MKKFEEAVSLCDESLKIKFKEYTVETKDKAQYYIDNPESRYKTNPKISPKSILTHKKVNSTNIESVGYNEDKRTLEILFRGSGVYTYFDVSKNVYQELVTSDSVGTYFHQNILNKFKYEKVN
ncbi:MAG: KTSC domain-containing protein [Thaumarchaeota archaeon]|nr:KTSC domain-containing protein [Nitrososphaerota archaeon]